MMLNPKELIIKERLSNVERVLAVVSPKGGVGKTLISVMLALSLRNRNLSVGLLDLDVTNPTAHLVLGINVRDISPKEEKGVKPPLINGIKFMSVAYYSGDKALPLRGYEIVNIIHEVLAITIWGTLNYLIIDTPPGVSDEVLEIMRLVSPLVLIITTSSPLSVRSTIRLIEILRDSKVKIIGIVENMSRDHDVVVRISREYNVRYLGKIPYIEGVDDAIGKPEVMENMLREYIERITNNLISSIRY